MSKLVPVSLIDVALNQIVINYSILSEISNICTALAAASLDPMRTTVQHNAGFAYTVSE